MNWETVIGLETHVELATKSKIFCACTTAFGGAPNTHCCPVCTGMPGALPVLNGKVVEYAVRAALALGCTVTRYSRFDRKNYFYPDLPKAYQISQLYLPIGRDGAVEAGGRTVGIHELHMEEDAGKLIHDPWTEQTKIDYNRCGVPLIEIVTEPDFRTAEEVSRNDQLLLNRIYARVEEVADTEDMDQVMILLVGKKDPVLPEDSLMGDTIGYSFFNWGDELVGVTGRIFTENGLGRVLGMEYGQVNVESYENAVKSAAGRPSWPAKDSVWEVSRGVIAVKLSEPD